MIRKNYPTADITDLTDLPIEKILELKEQHTVQAMSLYEFLDLLLTAIPILIDLIQRLLHRRKKHRRKK